MLLDPATVSATELYRFLTCAVVPRPIAWVSTRAADGTPNLAPFSYFTLLSSTPPLLGFAVRDREGDPKDTVRNIRETGDFVVNMVSEPLLQAMVVCSGDWPRATSEFGPAGLTPAPAERVGAPRVLESPLQLECRLHRELPLGDCVFVIGEIVAARADDALLTAGRVDPMKLRTVGRLGGELYAPLREVLEVPRPRVSRATGERTG